MSQQVVALFKTHDATQRAVDALASRGFARKQMSVVMNDRTHGKHFAVKESSKAPEGAATGGVLGLLGGAAVAVGSLGLPGGFMVTGPLMAALGGAGTGAAGGGLIGALVGAGMPEHEAKLYSEGVSKGGFLVGVEVAESRKDEAKDILKSHEPSKLKS